MTAHLIATRDRVRRRWQRLDEMRRVRIQDQLDNLIDAWHTNDPGDGMPLHEYLGMSWGQYADWAAGRGIPQGWVPPEYDITKRATSRDEGNTMTTTATAVEPITGGVDDKGFLDLSHLRGDYEYLQTLLKQRRLLDEAIEVYEAKFKAPMEAVAGATGFKIDGMPRYRYDRNGTFPAAKYAAENPHVAAAYQMPTTKFDIEAFKRDRPEEYAQWRARSFKQISETKKGR